MSHLCSQHLANEEFDLEHKVKQPSQDLGRSRSIDVRRIADREQVEHVLTRRQREEPSDLVRIETTDRDRSEAQRFGLQQDILSDVSRFPVHQVARDRTVFRFDPCPDASDDEHDRRNADEVLPEGSASE